MTTATTKRTDQATGDDRRDGVLELVESRSKLYVLRGRRALLIRLLDVGVGTAHDVYEAVTLPVDVDPHCFGAVPTPLARAGIIQYRRHVKTRRAERNASRISEWELADRAAAVAWLRENPEIPDEPPDEKTRQALLPGMEL